MPGPQNKTVTYTGSTAVVHGLHFSRDPSNPAGPITGDFVGRVTLVGGVLELINTPSFVLTGALETAVRNLNGIEAP
jgi:hypothetical protein